MKNWTSNPLIQNVQKLNLKCKEGHSLKIDTSSRHPGGKFLVNLRVLHDIYCSGLRYAQYERFAKYAGIGVISETALHEIQDMYCDVTESVVNESVSDALDKEVGITVLKSENARYGWRTLS